MNTPLRDEIYKIFYDLGVPSANTGMEKPYVIEAADQILSLVASKMPEKTKTHSIEELKALSSSGLDANEGFGYEMGWNAFRTEVKSILKGEKQ
jgi:hypothetical protein